MRNVIEQSFDLVDVERAVGNAEAHLEYIRELAYNFEEDPDQENRLSQQKCLVCYYRKGLMSVEKHQTVYSKCGICKEASVLISTNRTISVCPDCIKENDLCKSCGATMTYKRKRKLKPFSKK